MAKYKSSDRLWRSIERSVFEHLKFARYGDKDKDKVHIYVPDASMTSLGYRFPICGGRFGTPNLLKGPPALQTDVCRKCRGKMDQIVKAIVEAQTQFMWDMAMKGSATIDVGQLREALEKMLREDIPEEEHIGPIKLALPDEFLPTGTGRLLSDDW